MKRGFVDLVIAGPDMSGTSTQVQDVIGYFQRDGKIVRDIRGTEIDALFHVHLFRPINRKHLSYRDFFVDNLTTPDMRDNFLAVAAGCLIGGGTNQDLRVASMVSNKITTYIDPNSADVWVMEEPTKRGAGQVNRVIEQNRSGFGSEINPQAAAEAHSVYRTDEFLRFRGPLRDAGKIVIRSRSEESACYQIFDEKMLLSGVSRDYYFGLAGHKVAFGNAPSNIFVVCGPENWTEKSYLELKRDRSGKDRTEDDHERMAGYQVLVNKRYATDWLEGLYKEGCARYGGTIPKITRFNIYDTREEIKNKMNCELEKILNE